MKREIVYANKRVNFFAPKSSERRPKLIPLFVPLLETNQIERQTLIVILFICQDHGTYVKMSDCRADATTVCLHKMKMCEIDHY